MVEVVVEVVVVVVVVVWHDQVVVVECIVVDFMVAVVKIPSEMEVAPRYNC